MYSADGTRITAYLTFKDDLQAIVKLENGQDNVRGVIALGGRGINSMHTNANPYSRDDNRGHVDTIGDDLF